MLTFDQKLSIIESFQELERKNVSMNRVNFHYPDSSYDKKIVVYHLHPNGNGYVYGEFLDGYESDGKGMVNIRDFTGDELKTIIELSIESLTASNTIESAIIEDYKDERWVNTENHTLILVHEEDSWNVYAGLNLDGTFLSYNEAKQYLEEEGFRKR
ncbi:hypothetical protein [Mesobacillus subterraneus]|uniref:Uncharacterized protein n=1 Tax=Mesobacillus subterraneus TaxID=285983 RepID=A0A0D6Z828_9BACI|nr:hypothetical protein [Mesobacillus subterraneus]KIY21712.1 hypothetical protein UB32_12460 [Mesobacillus subterraneus]